MTATNLTLDYYKVKVFLYKYTPEFRKRAASPTSPQKTSPLFEIDRYELDLDKKYFTKYDISDYVSSYNFAQELDDSSYSWSINLYDPVLSYSHINDHLKVEGVIRLSPFNLDNLASYEAQAKALSDSAAIKKAKRARGKAESPMASHLGNTLPKVEGLKLSDLIQPYDMVSLFLYKGKEPLEDIRGTVSTVDGLEIFSKVDSASVLLGGQLTKKQLQTESILLSSISKPTLGVTPGDTLFSNEFIGFILSKNFSSSVAGVDTLTISGNGVTRLFGATRRILKSSLMEKSIYDINQLVKRDQYTAYQNTYVGKKLVEIFDDLFWICYKIKFDKVDNSSLSVVQGGGIVPKDIFYDTVALKLYNKSQINMFSVPPYLLSLVMARHGFRHRNLNAGPALAELEQSVKHTQPRKIVSKYQYAVSTPDTVSDTDILTASGASNLILQASIDRVLDGTSAPMPPVEGVRPAVFIESDLNVLKPYFKFIEDVLRFFSPDLKTPYEIIDELKAKTFLEFIDNPDGSVTIREPKYNDTTDILLSSSLDMISSSYNSNISSLLSRQQVGYSLDAIAELSPFDFFAFTDGKLLIQFGQLESTADANANAKTEQLNNQSLVSVRQSGIIAYAEYLLRLHNASLHTGTVTCGYDPRIVVGKTFFDDRQHKFGYITHVSKSITVTGEVTMSFGLSYVRDATRTSTTIDVQTLLTLSDITQKFVTSSTAQRFGVK